MELWIIAVFILAALYAFRNSAPINQLKDRFRVWREDRAKQKKLDIMYTRLDHEGNSKFHKVENIRMMNQMKRSRK